MLGGDVNQYPILLLVNYWEIRPARMGARLDELLKRGISHFATYVPWQAAESDISNTLIRFLQAVSERKMTVHLILSPEVGIHYPYSGLPKDVIARKENMAQHCHSGPITANLPPNAFQLPSLFAAEFTKRYNSFLARMDGIFADLSKSQPSLLRGVTAVLTGSLWKYYRSPAASAHGPFAGPAGDYSSHAALAYRTRVEQFFSQREFMDPTPASANRWKTRSLEDINRRWFYQQSENVFRSRSLQLLKKRYPELKVSEVELYTPEADSSVIYMSFLQMLSDGHSDFGTLSKLLDESAIRTSSASVGSTDSWVHWTSMGGYRMLADGEKQFLFLKSLLLMGSQGGRVLIDDSEWFSFSSQFRTRIDTIARGLQEKKLQLKRNAYYLVPHLWSDYGTLWDELTERMGPSVKMVSSLDLILQGEVSNLLIVDPSHVMTREMIQKITAWARAGRVVVLPRSKLYTDLARAALDLSLHQTKKIEIDLGFTYQLHSLGDGKIIVYDLPDLGGAKGEPLSAWKVFLDAILSVAEINNYCQLSDSRLNMIPLELQEDRVAIFVLNASRRTVTADIIFPKEVRISDFGPSLSQDAGLEQAGDGEGGSESDSRCNRFTLDVPPFGVLPLMVDGLRLSESREKQLAAQVAVETRENAMEAAFNQLTGFGLHEEGIEEIWS